MKIILAGGSGYLGQMLARHYQSIADDIVILSRVKKEAVQNVRTVVWDARSPGDWINELTGADVLINLTGKNVNCRYTDANQKEILQSRLESTAVLGQALRQVDRPPSLWIQAASATIYRHAEDRGMTEESGEIGDDFSMNVCRQWEAACREQSTPQTRKVVLRIAIVLGNGGGAFPRLKNLTLVGLGGRQGNGRQWVSWIHEKDVFNIIEWIRKEKQAQGVYNCSAPSPVTNTQLMKILRHVYQRPWGLPTPSWLLSMGAWLIGTEPELILKSRWVLPERLLREKFSFEYPDLTDAVVHLKTNA
jgi:uncharacterized protein